MVDKRSTNTGVTALNTCPYLLHLSEEMSRNIYTHSSSGQLIVKLDSWLHQSQPHVVIDWFFSLLKRSWRLLIGHFISTCTSRYWTVKPRVGVLTACLSIIHARNIQIQPSRTLIDSQSWWLPYLFSGVSESKVKVTDSTYILMLDIMFEYAPLCSAVIFLFWLFSSRCTDPSAYTINHRPQ